MGNRVQAAGVWGTTRYTWCWSTGRPTGAGHPACRRDQVVIRTRTGSIAVVAALAALAVTGCGERPQVINYKQGTYQGKPDTPAYAGAPFNGNRQQWDNAIDTRMQGQNEYARTRD